MDTIAKPPESPRAKHQAPNFARQLVDEEIKKRRKKNKYYSMRAMARDLDIGVSTLSSFLSGKRSLSVKNAEKICQKLGLSQQAKERFILNSQISQSNQSITEKAFFNIMSHWHFFAILNLAKNTDCHSDPAWLACRLAIEITSAQEARDILLRFGFVQIVDERLKPCKLLPSIKSKIPLDTLRKHHQAILSQAGIALIKDPLKMRDMSSLVIAIDPQNIETAKKMLQKCRQQITEQLSSKGSGDYYILNYHLFSIQGNLFSGK